MSIKEEIKKREQIARQAIYKAFGTEEDEFGGTLFVTHHLEEIEKEYWVKHIGTEIIEPEKILGLLVLKSHWGGEKDIDIFDFTLPEDITDYVVSVQFDEKGEVSNIVMES